MVGGWLETRESSPPIWLGSYAYSTTAFPNLVIWTASALPSMRRPYFNLQSAIYRVGGRPSNLHGVTAVTTGASWAPDGDRIAFGKSLPGAYTSDPYSDALHSRARRSWLPANSCRSLQTSAFEGRVQITQVSWSPDGKEILFILSDEEEHQRLVTPATHCIDLSCTSRRNRVETACWRMSAPYTAAAWSPDSSQIAVRVDPQFGYETLPNGQIIGRLKHISPIFELLIVDRDGTVQQVLGREEVIRTR